MEGAGYSLTGAWECLLLPALGWGIPLPAPQLPGTQQCLTALAPPLLPPGTSSILAGAVMASLYRAAGKAASTESLVHAVLHLEQRLTTGRAWGSS